MKAQLGLPFLLKNITKADSSTEPKVRLTANSALWYGSTVASGPAQLQVINYTHTAVDGQYRVTSSSGVWLVPGQDKLSLNAWVLDGLSQVVAGLDYTSRVLVCPSDTINCDDEASILPPLYISMDHVSGLFRFADIPLACPLDGQNIRVQISLVALESLSMWFPVMCAPCRGGQAKTLDGIGQAWWCASCSSKQYVVDPNNPSFGCKVLSHSYHFFLFAINRAIPVGLPGRSKLQWKFPHGPC
jgi:hypothetical protein